MKNILYKENNPVTLEEIEFAEHKFQVKLPKTYVELLKISNGGALNYCWLNVQGVEELESEDGYINVDRLLGIKIPNEVYAPSETNIMDTEYLKKEWGINEDNIIIIAGDGHYWIALDYRSLNEPSITFFDTNNEKEIHLYNNFDEMINNMCDSTKIEYDETIEANFGIEKLNKKLYENSYAMIHEGIKIWEELVLAENKIDHSHYDKILDIFKMKNLEFLLEEERDTLRLQIGLTVCKILQYDKNIIDKKFLEDFLNFLNNCEDLDGLKFMVDGALSEYKERWNKD